MDTVASQKRSLQQIYAKLNQSGQSFALAMTAYNRIAGSVIFDPVYYDIFYPDARKSNLEPLAHYILHGAQEGRSPHPLFDGKFYLKQLGAKAKSANGLAHYLENSEVPNVNPHPLFDWEFYKFQSGDAQKCSPLDAYLLNFPSKIENPLPLFDSAHYLAENSDVRDAKINPLVHFVLLGAYEGRSPHPLFDTKYYLNSFGGQTVPKYLLSKDHSVEDVYQHAADLIRSHAPGALHNALVHYMEFGSTERRNPHALFSSSFYLENHPEIAEEDVNPLIHYVTKGAKSGLKPHILFDPSFYARGLKEKFDTEMPVESLLSHFLKEGFDNRVLPHPHFDSNDYIDAYATVRAARINPLVHYLTEPAEAEHRITNQTFDGEFYMRVYNDVAPSGLTPLEHYIRYGQRENRSTNFAMWAKKIGKELDPILESMALSDGLTSFPANASNPAVSILLHGSGNASDLLKCLYALKLQAEMTPFELIVTSANDEEKRVLDSLGINVRDRGGDQTMTLNRAAREATGPILIVMKSNVVILKNFLRKITAFFELHASHMILSPKVITRMGRIKHVGYLLGDHCELTRIKTFYDAFGDEQDDTISIDACLRECLIIRQNDFLSLTGFDEKLGEAKFQDVEFCLRARRAGYEILAYPAATVLALNEFARPSVQQEPLTHTEDEVRKQLAEAFKHRTAETIGTSTK